MKRYIYFLVFSLLFSGIWTISMAQDKVISASKENKVKQKTVKNPLLGLSKEEVAKLCGIKADSATIEMLRNKAKNQNISEEIKLGKAVSVPDWQSLMSTVESQGGCGNCWAHASTGVAEALIHYRIGSSIGVDMDELYIANNSPCGDCDGTASMTCGMSFIYDYKVRSEQSLNSNPNYDHGYWTISSYSSNTASIAAIKSSLQSSPVYAQMEVFEDFVNPHPDSIYTHKSGDHIAFHAVTIVDYNDTDTCWTIKNSWGDGWGNDGYLRIKYGECLIDVWANVTATVTSDECYAKLSPDLITSLTTAMDYDFVTSEYAYVIGSSSLTDNTTVNSGETVEIKSAATINLNGYNLINNVGTITNNGTITPEIVITGQDDYYGTLGSACSNASSGQTVSVANDHELINNVTVNDGVTVELNGDLTVPSGKTLDIDPGGTVEVAAGSNEIKISGSLVATGTESKNITFTSAAGSPSSGDWDGIIIDNNNITMEYCQIEYADYGIYCDDKDFFTLKNSKVYWISNDGAYLNSSNGYFENNHIFACGGAAVKLIASGAELKKNHIDYCDYGLHFTSVSCINLSGSSGEGTPGENLMEAYGTYEFYGDCSLGYWGFDEYESGQNSFVGCWPIGYLSSYSDIYAEDNWWGEEPVSEDFFVLVGNSEIDFDPWLEEDPLGKVAAPLIDSADVDTAKELFINAIKHEKSGNCELGWEKYKEVIEKYPKSIRAKSALIRMSYLKNKLPDEDFITYLYDVIQNNDDLKQRAMLVSINHLLDEKYIYNAIEICDYLLKNYPDDSNSAYILYKLFRVYLEYLGDSAKAEDLLSELSEKDVRNDFLPYSVRMLDDFKNGKLKRKLTDSELANLSNHRISESIEKVSKTEEQKIPSTFTLQQNYPNPFNPVTNITFGIPEVSDVKLKIYNILGQEVVALVNGQLNAGTHNVKWDASEYSSGVYICRLEAGSYVKSIKLLLMK